MSDVQTAVQVSAGGVVFRKNAGQVEIILISVGPTPRWQLPKGMVDPGETNEIAARREVREEGGVESELVAPLDTIEYWYYAARGELKMRFHKFVHFFLFEYLAGDPGDHDHEVNEARWVEINAALQMVRFESEKRVIRMAMDLLQMA